MIPSTRLRPSSIRVFYSFRLVFARGIVVGFCAMAEKENSAFRLYRFIQKMVSQPEHIPTAQVLLNAFGIDKDSSARQQNAMLSRVTILLFTEMELLVTELKRNEYSDEAIKPITAPFDSLSAGGLANQWQRSKGAFAASLLSLRPIGESPNLLTDDGVAISKDDLAELSGDIETLRQEVQISNLPAPVKEFIFHQLNIITGAIRDYPLAGVKAFKAAARDAVFHEAEHSEILVEFSEQPQMTSLKAIQAKVVKVAKFSIEFSKFLAAMDTIYHHGGAALQTAVGATHHLSGWVQHLPK